MIGVHHRQRQHVGLVHGIAAQHQRGRQLPVEISHFVALRHAIVGNREFDVFRREIPVRATTGRSLRISLSHTSVTLVRFDPGRHLFQRFTANEVMIETENAFVTEIKRVCT